MSHASLIPAHKITERLRFENTLCLSRRVA